MTRDEFRSKFAEIVEVPPNSLIDETPLDTLVWWDSVAMVSFIALADEHAGTQLSARQLRECNSVGDLLSAAKV